MTDHNALGNSELHEPKGVASASDGQVYVADGAGSGTWEYLYTEQNYGAISTGTSFDLTGLGDYAAIYITMPNISSDTNTDHSWSLQFGNAGGLTTSAVYFSTIWDYGAYTGSGSYGAETSLRGGQSFTRTPGVYCHQSNNYLFLNFNKPRYTVGGGVSNMGLFRFANAFIKPGCCFYVREEKAYDRLRLTTSVYNLAGGDIRVMGLKG